jgi:type VI secretion system ImpC/EvpB family protein
MESFDALALPRDLSKIFEGKELEAWHEFRAMEDARYVTLVLPRTLLRLPYGSPYKRNTTQCEGLNFEETVAAGGAEPRFSPDDPTMPLSYPSPDTANFLWGNAAWVLAERITNAFTLYGWTAAIRGVEGGGLVEGLPLYSYTSDAGTTELFCPTEVAITDRREKELSDLGFMSLCHCKAPATPPSSAARPPTRPRPTSRRTPTPTPGCRRCCPTCWPRRASRTTSRSSCARSWACS